MRVHDAAVFSDTVQIEKLIHNLTPSITAGGTAIGVSTTGLVGIVNTIASADNRAINAVPSAYAPGVTLEFKDRAAVGLPATGLALYAFVKTERLYGFGVDFSGGPAFQYATILDSAGLRAQFIRQSNGGGTAWGPWKSINGDNIRTLSATTTIGYGDDTILVTNGAVNVNYPLPAPNTCEGKRFTFARAGSLNTGVITISSPNIQSSNGSFGASAILETYAATGGAYGVRKTWQSTGTQFMLVG